MNTFVLLQPNLTPCCHESENSRSFETPSYSQPHFNFKLVILTMKRVAIIENPTFEALGHTGHLRHVHGARPHRQGTKNSCIQSIRRSRTCAINLRSNAETNTHAAVNMAGRRLHRKWIVVPLCRAAGIIHKRPFSED